MHFGMPRLNIREPYESKSKSKTVQRMAAHRLVTVRGQWRLWIFCAYWRVYREGQFLGGYASTFRKATIAAHFLDGQKLIKLAVNPGTGATTLEFDLGGVLEVRRFSRYDKDADLWSLYKPNGYVLSVYGDGTFDYQPGSGLDKRKHVIKRSLDA